MPEPAFHLPDVRDLTDEAVRSLFLTLDHLPLPRRAATFLRRAGLRGARRSARLGDLVTLTHEEVSTIEGAGKEVLGQLKASLSDFGLRLGLRIPAWSQLEQPRGGGPAIVHFYDVDRLRKVLRLPRPELLARSEIFSDGPLPAPRIRPTLIGAEVLFERPEHMAILDDVAPGRFGTLLEPAEIQQLQRWADSDIAYVLLLGNLDAAVEDMLEVLGDGMREDGLKEEHLAAAASWARIFSRAAVKTRRLLEGHRAANALDDRAVLHFDIHPNRRR